MSAARGCRSWAARAWAACLCRCCPPRPPSPWTRCRFSARRATINFFNLMFNALYLLYAVRVLHIRPGVVGVLLGVAAAGGLLGALVTKRAAVRIGVGWTYAAGCLLFTAPLVAWPLVHGRLPLVLAMLFGGELGSGFGVMMLDSCCRRRCRDSGCPRVLAKVLAQHRAAIVRDRDLLEAGLLVELAGAHVAVGLPVG